MSFKILALVAFAVASQAQDSPGTWNELAGVDKALFHPSIDSIQSKSLDPPALIAELEELLGQDKILDSLYTTYVNLYKDELPASMNSAAKAIFKRKLVSIVNHNLEEKEGKHTYTQGVNQFTDLSLEEYQQFLGLTISPSDFLSNSGIPHLGAFKPDPNVQAPTSWDWNQQQKVTPVKHQGSCGSCYAFAAVGVLESLYLIKNGETYDLSEQQVVDCSNNSKCNGGGLGNTAEYLSRGVATEADYPYTARNGTCKNGVTAAAPRCTSHKDVGTESVLVDAVYKGPVFIAMDAGSEAFQNYKSGLFSSCDKNLNHGVIIVGYGSEGGKNFWNIKNSWGTRWGEKGYVRIPRGSGTCGIGKASTTMTSN